MFTAAALLLVIGSAVIMETIGLSMSLGAFLAGLLLADSEFRHELEADIEPFKGLLLGLFFMTVGMGANLALAARACRSCCSGSRSASASSSSLVVFAITAAAKIPGNEGQRLAVALAQGGEFAFVLFGAAAAVGVLDARIRASCSSWSSRSRWCSPCP